MKAFLKSALSEPGEGGGVSSARILSALFAILAIVVVGIIVYRLVKINDVPLLQVWLSDGIPNVGKLLTGLVAAPYFVNKASNTISDITAMFRRDK
ncbi:MAG TPA: hypothetical protein VGG97_09520 [Bryobacteraceae bacterium]|jgi:hypothetical protein